MHDGGGRPDDRKGRNRVVLTSPHSNDSICSRSGDRKEISVAGVLLTPLRYGKPVMLVVDDPRLPKRKRIEKPLLFLIPQSVYGAPSTKLLVSFQTYGSEVIDTAKGIKPMELMRVGLGVKMAVSLAKSLDLVFKKGEPNGSEKS